MTTYQDLGNGLHFSDPAFKSFHFCYISFSFQRCSLTKFMTKHLMLKRCFMFSEFCIKKWKRVRQPFMSPYFFCVHNILLVDNFFKLKWCINMHVYLIVFATILLGLKPLYLGDLKSEGKLLPNLMLWSYIELWIDGSSSIHFLIIFKLFQEIINPISSSFIEENKDHSDRPRFL